MSGEFYSSGSSKAYRKKRLAADTYFCDICGFKPKNIRRDHPHGLRMYDLNHPDLRLFTDHSHKNMLIRGLLCGGCNAALGAVKDSIENLTKAIEYLKNAPTIQNVLKEFL